MPQIQHENILIKPICNTPEKSSYDIWSIFPTHCNISEKELSRTFSVRILSDEHKSQISLSEIIVEIHTLYTKTCKRYIHIVL